MGKTRRVRKNLCKGFDESTRDKLSEIIFNALYKRFGDGDVQLGTHLYTKESEKWVNEAELFLENSGWLNEWFPFIECCIESRFNTYRVHIDHKDKPGMVNVTLAKSTGGTNAGGAGGRLWNVSVPEEDALKIIALGFFP